MKFTEHFKKPIARIIIIALLISLTSTYGVYHFENNAGNAGFQTFPDYLYAWAAVVTTVGASVPPIYEDISKLFLSIAMISGTFMYFGAFSELILYVKDRYESRYKGITKYKGSNHVVIVGYNTLALGIIHLLDRILLSEIDIVLVTSRIDTNPDVDRLKFVKDHPATTTALNKAGIAAAKLAIILSNDEVSVDKMDVNTVLIGGMIEEINPQVFTLVELSTRKRIESIEDFRVDATITFTELLEDTRHRDVKPHIIGKISRELREEMLREEYRS